MEFKLLILFELGEERVEESVKGEDGIEVSQLVEHCDTANIFLN